MLSKKAINEFKEIWKEEFGDNLTEEKACTKTIKFLKLISVIYKPIPKKHGTKKTN